MYHFVQMSSLAQLLCHSEFWFWGDFFFIENNDKYTQVTGLLPHPFLNNHTFFAVAKVLRLCIGKAAGLRM